MIDSRDGARWIMESSLSSVWMGGEAAVLSAGRQQRSLGLLLSSLRRIPNVFHVVAHDVSTVHWLAPKGQ